MNINIEPLTADRLEEAILFLENVFQNLISIEDLDHPRKMLPASLNLQGESKYFLATVKNKIVGITGYYTMKEDRADADWLAWFAVAQEYRRLGIGTKLIDSIILNAKKRKKKFLRLYTNPEEDTEAKVFYDRLGFITVKKAPSPYKKNFVIDFMELRL